jgi:hypothetical protein
MNMASASVGLDAIRNAQSVCQGAIQDLNNSSQKLSNRYQEAGLQWKDNKYEQLGVIINDCSRVLRSPTEELFECLNKLKEIETVLLEYESVNL